MTLSKYLQSDLRNIDHAVLLGHPLTHSLSPVMHNTAARYHGLEFTYSLIDLPQSQLSRVSTLFNNPRLRGANITIPYKQLLLDLVDDVTPVAQKIGAINTIFKQGHRLIGDNTDAFGFMQPLVELGYDLANKRVIIFGTGGATQAVLYVLEKLGMAEAILISRHPERCKLADINMHIAVESYDTWTSFAAEAVLIVNATPLGMTPETDASPVEKADVPYLKEKICYDIVYNPLQTSFLSQARKAGAETIPGIDMLMHQGDQAFRHWTGKPFPLKKVKKQLVDALT